MMPLWDEEEWERYEKYKTSKPSEVHDAGWLFADVERKDYNEIVITGKWLLFIKKDEVDESWEKVKILLAGNKLGRSAKVSTAKESYFSRYSDESVICIYTRDSRDIGDVGRIAYHLLKNFDVSAIHYKEDIVTILGIYDHNYDGQICKYSAYKEDVESMEIDEYIDYFTRRGVNEYYDIKDMEKWRLALTNDGFYSYQIANMRLSSKMKIITRKKVERSAIERV